MSKDQSQETLKKLASIAGVLILVSILFGPGGGIATIVALAAKLLWLVFLVSLTVGLYVALKNNLDHFQFGSLLNEFTNGYAGKSRVCPECGSNIREKFTYCPSCGRKNEEAGK